MLNHAIRYQPIVRTLERWRPARILEVGSGPEGLALFWRGTVVGTDVVFKRRPLHRAVVASGLRLPFADRSFPLVVSCDMLEHVTPVQRCAAVQEMARVADEGLLLVFPSGPAAVAVYNELAEALAPALPQWLQEHITNGLPDAGEVAAWLRQAGWVVNVQWYESAAAHKKLMLYENHWPVKVATFALMRLVGPRFVRLVGWPSAGPWLRVLIKAERPAQQHADLTA
ncbi:MAG: hypothetical protein DCC55_04305 [Chloroflexi bacterium]|nr:MAG: hypothetical protein DCC55_04305 [Chloroflexota bacterium]